MRKFEAGKSVSHETLQRIVDCGRWAPSGVLRQAQRLVDHAMRRLRITS